MTPVSPPPARSGLFAGLLAPGGFEELLDIYRVTLITVRLHSRGVWEADYEYRGATAATSVPGGTRPWTTSATARPALSSARVTRSRGGGGSPSYVSTKGVRLQ